ncbi:hypothetical protein B6U99_00840 [Candidatus Geothermarchaeota archaeon ex4572_27]|nr:MAG: hypothetical protein B6U99_00840 [Candidatus Geothermarchaeota archaeon ex4572_27]
MEALFPLRHVLVFRWRFGEARDLDELMRRMGERMFYAIRPAEDVLVATSKTKPSAVIFVFLREGDDGGRLILIQTPGGRYSYPQLVHYVRIFAKTVGIEVGEEITLAPRG